MSFDIRVYNSYVDFFHEFFISPLLIHIPVHLLYLNLWLPKLRKIVLSFFSHIVNWWLCL